ncbi:dTDP-4-amino-4,6-dideoxygalactose transaminase [Roseburia hominis]|uniref:dTDP-4-amino-4,6-dideoxygalactose transaminase n=1 Tax=Roseburia hominis TaxID=301301 RepID=UPI001F430C5E|nr:dTDP-4-amino-4,6-dideoxygalactose transaminase [Roseburia hominis]
MISFNEPTYVEKGIGYITEAILKYQRLNGDGVFTARCTKWLEERFGSKVLLTTSCTHALEMASLLADIKPGDEVIMPAFTFVSTADAFVLRGAKIKFVDIRKDTLNIDETLIEEAITEKTKAIVPVHYAGVGCEMDTIMDIAKRHHLFVIEDAAQGMMSTYKDKYLGTIGDFGAYSFHETKNYTMGEGGLIFVNRDEYVHRAEIIREKGTNRAQYFRGEIDKYSWVDEGSSYLPSELNAAYLLPQLEIADEINNKRLHLWNLYYEELKDLEKSERIELPFIPKECQHNAHMFYIKTKDLEERTKLINYLDEHGVNAVFHYVPLHTSIAGRKYGQFIGEDRYTTKESERLVRLPMFFALEDDKVRYVAEQIKNFYQ